MLLIGEASVIAMVNVFFSSTLCLLPLLMKFEKFIVTLLTSSLLNLFNFTVVATYGKKDIVETMVEDAIYHATIVGLL